MKHNHVHPYQKFILILIIISNFPVHFEGLLCNCVLPAGLNETKVRQVTVEDSVSGKKKLRSHSSRFPSSSNPRPSLSSRSSSSSTRSSRQRSRLASSS